MYFNIFNLPKLAESSPPRHFTDKLYKAIYRNKVRAIELCLNVGVNVNEPITRASNDGPLSLTPVQWAIHHNCVDALRILVSRGARLNLHNSTDFLLIRCIRENKPEIADYLVKMGADPMEPDLSDRTPLSWAIAAESEDMINLILDNGGFLTAGTSLLDAVDTNNFEIVKLLLRRAARIECQDEDGYTPLLKCVGAAETIDFRILDKLLEEESAVNQVTKKGTPLMAAVNPRNMNLEMVQALMRRGADANLSVDGTTPLIQCIQGGSLECLKILLKSGTDVNKATTEGAYPLMCAIMNENLEMVRLMVENGAQLTISDLEGNTPLVAAVGRGNFEMTRFLVDRGGIDLNRKNLRNETALSRALSNNDHRTFRYLTRAGADEDSMVARDVDRKAQMRLNFAMAVATVKTHGKNLSPGKQ